MDCYIVRIYRHITGNNGQGDEIAGLVEEVGNQSGGKPFTTYDGLINAILSSADSAEAENIEKDSPAVGDVLSIKALRARRS